MDTAISDHCVQGLLNISANTAKKLCKWDPWGDGSCCWLPTHCLFNNLPWFAAAGHKFHYTAYLAEGKQASVRKYNDCTQHIPVQQVMARRQTGALLIDCLPSTWTTSQFLCTPPGVTNTALQMFLSRAGNFILLS